MFPHVENVVYLDNDYYTKMQRVLSKKIADAKHYAPLYDHTVILVEDSLSGSNHEIERRRPRVEKYLRSLQPPSSVEVVLIRVGLRRAGVAHRFKP